jgi:hypothetical protein
MSHDHIEFGPEIPSLGSDGSFLPFDPQKYIFSLSM